MQNASISLIILLSEIFCFLLDQDFNQFNTPWFLNILINVCKSCVCLYY